MAEIEGSLNFSLRGEFKHAEIVSASTVAPDGKTYELKVVGEHPPIRPGFLFQFLRISYGEAHPDFSIGKWKVVVTFKVDNEEFRHEAEHLVTWRKPDAARGMQEWVQETQAEPGGAGQSATSESSADHYPTAKPVPNRPGFYFNPFTNRVVDMREIPGGKLVMDPLDPDKTRLFRVPSDTQNKEAESGSGE